MVSAWINSCVVEIAKISVGKAHRPEAEEKIRERILEPDGRIGFNSGQRFFGQHTISFPFAHNIGIHNLVNVDRTPMTARYGSVDKVSGVLLQDEQA